MPCTARILGLDPLIQVAQLLGQLCQQNPEIPDRPFSGPSRTSGRARRNAPSEVDTTRPDSPLL